jgi:lactoylglutathione lyase
MNLLVNIDVPDIAQAEAFCRDAFGLKTGRRLGEDCVEMLGAGTPIYLLKKAAGTFGAGNSIRDYARHWTPVHVDVVVDDLETALARALRAGAVQEGDIREADWGRIVQIADPSGHGWCLLQFLGRGYDEIAT